MLGRTIVCVALVASACGLPSQSATASPAPDAAKAYTTLIHGYYARYESAKGDAYDFCVVGTDTAKCYDRGVLMISVWQNLLQDLDTTPAPPKFAADDATIRKQLPKAIDDLTTMVAAAKVADQSGMVSAANLYIGDLVPGATDALHDIDKVWPKE
jgi:hypothetical protein